MPVPPANSDIHMPASPCIGICRIEADGLCRGCRRTLAEIARWGTMSDDERRRWMREVRPSRPLPTQ
jgi:predicted Fe-S protein YdhL (DUF1289 family)